MPIYRSGHAGSFVISYWRKGPGGAPIDRTARTVPEIVRGHMFFFVSARNVVSVAENRASPMRRGSKDCGLRAPKSRHAKRS
jgi:hypothetical protein